MLVADNSQNSSSATLGAKEAIQFGITNDASFFQILSANLYSNQKLAFTREVLCNLWDAHIDANKTDVYGQVIITKDYDLIMRDFGKGIPHERMGEVYGTYGASTKTNDSKSTGGFGLGCKSPFAYCDSFRVVSCHNGTKTVYNITKSSVETDGKPGIITISSMPTDETGLTVIIPLKPRDVQEIVGYIEAIVKHGEMNIEFCNQIVDDKYRKLPKLGLSFEPGTYDLNHEHWYYYYMGDHEVFVRYGNVVYPALDTPGTEGALSVIKCFMHIVGLDRILVQAAPDTLALTPSREALSSQQMTIDGLVDVCTDLVARVEEDIKHLIPMYMAKVCKRLRKGNVTFQDARWFPWWDMIESHMVQRYMKSPYGSKYRDHYRGQLQNAELDGQLKSLGMAKHKLMKPLRNALFIAKKHNNIRPVHRFMMQYAYKPILRVMGENRKALPIRDYRLRRKHQYYTKIMTKGFIPKYSQYSNNSLNTDLALLKPVVFITRRLKDINYSLRGYPGFEHNHEAACLMYFIGAKKEAKQVPIEIFTKAGWEVVDLTLNHSWDVNAPAKRPAKPKKPVVEFKLLTLRNVVHPDDNQFDAGKLLTLPNDAPTCEKPIFYVEVAAINDERLGYFGFREDITEDMLDTAVIVRNGTEKRMAERRGAINVDAYFIKPYLAAMFSKEMKTYLTKERQTELRYHHDIQSGTLRMLKALDISIPGLSKLRYDKDFERIFRCVEDLKPDNLVRAEVIDADTASKLHDVLNMHLQEFAWIKQIHAMKKDAFLCYMTEERIREMVAACPERKPALRSLVLSALKNGKGKCKKKP